MRDQEQITYFASYDYRGKKQKFGIRAKDRAQHVYVIGKTGMGKSTLLENMAIQDLQNGNGTAFIDPHGSTAEKLLDYIPEERIEDVVYFAPFDMEYPISFNVMEDVGYDKRHLVVNNLMSAFKKIWVDAWSARMEYLLTNALLALIEYPGATLLSINRMFVDKPFRKKVLEHVTDPVVKSFWEEEFTKYTDRYTQEATPAIQNKVGQFLSNPLVRNIVGQTTSSFDIREMMDNRKILIMNLSKGRMGDVNARLLGSMLIIKIYLAAMSRADTASQELQKLPPFYFFVDEFQSFANETFADILSEARKYKLALTIAHQYVGQMSDEVRDAIFGNVGTMVTFRIGAEDAEMLEKEFAPTFSVEDMVSLGAYQIYLKLMIDGITSKPFSAQTMPPIEVSDTTHRETIITRSREKFAQTRQEVEAAIKEGQAPVGGTSAPAGEHSSETRSKQTEKTKTTERQPETKQKQRQREHPQPSKKVSEEVHKPFEHAFSEAGQAEQHAKDQKPAKKNQELAEEKERENVGTKTKQSTEGGVSLKILRKNNKTETKSPEHLKELRAALSEALTQTSAPQKEDNTKQHEAAQVPEHAPQESREEDTGLENKQKEPVPQKEEPQREAKGASVKREKTKQKSASAQEKKPDSRQKRENHEADERPSSPVAEIPQEQLEDMLSVDGEDAER